MGWSNDHFVHLIKTLGFFLSLERLSLHACCVPDPVLDTGNGGHGREGVYCKGQEEQGIIVWSVRAGQNLSCLCEF